MTLWHQITNAERDELVASIVGALSTAAIPAHLHDGLVRYFADGILPGSFLQAVLVNDLRQAVARGAPSAVGAMPAIVRWLELVAPPVAWGSREAVLAWTTTPDRLEV